MIINKQIFYVLHFQIESFEYLRISIDDILRLDEDMNSQDVPGYSFNSYQLIINNNYFDISVSYKKLIKSISFDYQIF